MDPTIRYSTTQCPEALEEKARMKNIPYREAIGALMYCAVATRPDISFAVALLSQFLENPGEVHWNGVKHVYRYLLGIKHLRLVFGETKNSIPGYTDADGATQDHRHAISGYTFLIDGGAVSWFSRKQEIVTLSTAEAEYVAATHAAKEAIWLKRLITETFDFPDNPITLRQPIRDRTYERQRTSFSHQTHRHPLPFHSLQCLRWQDQYHLLPHQRERRGHPNQTVTEHQSQTFRRRSRSPCALRGSVEEQRLRCSRRFVHSHAWTAA